MGPCLSQVFNYCCAQRPQKYSIRLICANKKTISSEKLSVLGCLDDCFLNLFESDVGVFVEFVFLVSVIIWVGISAILLF